MLRAAQRFSRFLTLGGNRTAPRGVSLLEITLGLAVVLVMMSLAASEYMRSQEQDRAKVAGAQLKQVGEAAEAWIRDNYDYLESDTGLNLGDNAGDTVVIPFTDSGSLRGLTDLGYIDGFDANTGANNYIGELSPVNPYNQTYVVIARRATAADAVTGTPGRIEAMVVVTDDSSDTEYPSQSSLGLAAITAGPRSGLVSHTNASDEILGLNGAWGALTTDFGIPGAQTVWLAYAIPTTTSALNEPWLARMEISGAPTLNHATTDISFRRNADSAVTGAGITETVGIVFDLDGGNDISGGDGTFDAEIKYIANTGAEAEGADQVRIGFQGATAEDGVVEIVNANNETGASGGVQANLVVNRDSGTYDPATGAAGGAANTNDYNLFVQGASMLRGDTALSDGTGNTNLWVNTRVDNPDGTGTVPAPTELTDGSAAAYDRYNLYLSGTSNITGQSLFGDDVVMHNPGGGDAVTLVIGQFLDAIGTSWDGSEWALHVTGATNVAGDTIIDDGAGTTNVAINSNSPIVRGTTYNLAVTGTSVFNGDTVINDGTSTTNVAINTDSATVGGTTYNLAVNGSTNIAGNTVINNGSSTTQVAINDNDPLTFNFRVVGTTNLDGDTTIGGSNLTVNSTNTTFNGSVTINDNITCGARVGGGSPIGACLNVDNTGGVSMRANGAIYANEFRYN